MSINGLTKRFFFTAVLFLTSLLGTTVTSAHHPVLGKFDDTSPVKLSGIVSYVDWRNPHAHIFMNVTGSDETENWAIEVESPIILRRNGWNIATLQPGDAIVVEGMRARNGTRQVWGEVVRLRESGRRVFTISQNAPDLPLSSRPTPRWSDGQPALGATPGSVGGYWSYPSETALLEDGVNVEFNEYGLLNDIDDADQVAPLQPWALALYKHRQQRHLRDDPMYLNCKPPGGPRQYQSQLGFQLMEDRGTERIFVLLGSGNHNYRIIFLDGRDKAATGLVDGDDDNPLYYGRSIGRWEGDTLVVETSGFNEDFWFTNGGLPHSNKLELVERYSRPDFDKLRYEVTINDPGAYTRPWSASWTLQWVGGEELPIHFCQNNRH